MGHKLGVGANVDDDDEIRYISLFAGIEAASVAWHPLNWKPVCFADIDDFPSAVLDYHYPDVPNVGDVTKVDWNEWKGKADLIVGGSPCQSFSVAGKRLGMDDPRGNLAIEFCRVVDEVRPTWFIFENVAGLLSSDEGRDFGTLLELMGECGYGIAYRILDARNFGVPQRRRRVFVIGHIGGDWRRAASVLFESESLSGNTTPSQAERETDSESLGRSTGTSSGTARGMNWDGSQERGTLTTRTIDQTMPDKSNFGGVIVPDPEGVDLFNQELTGDKHPPLRTAQGHGAPAVTSYPPSVMNAQADTVTAKFAKGADIPLQFINRGSKKNAMGNLVPEVVGALDTECGGKKTSHQSIKLGHIFADEEPIAIRTVGDYHDPSIIIDDKVFLAANPMSDRRMAIGQPVAIHPADFPTCEGCGGQILTEDMEIQGFRFVSVPENGLCEMELDECVEPDEKEMKEFNERWMKTVEAAYEKPEWVKAAEQVVYGQDADEMTGDVTGTITTKEGASSCDSAHMVVEPVPIQDPSEFGSQNGSGIGKEPISYTLTKAAKHAVAQPRDGVDTYNQEITGDVTHTVSDAHMEGMPKVLEPIGFDWKNTGQTNFEKDGTGAPVTVEGGLAVGIQKEPTHSFDPTFGYNGAFFEDVAPTLKVNGVVPISPAVTQREAIPFIQNVRDEVRDTGDLTGALTGPGSHQTTNLVQRRTIYRKSKNAQTDRDDEKWVESDPIEATTNTLTVWDHGDVRSRDIVVEQTMIGEKTYVGGQSRVNDPNGTTQCLTGGGGDDGGGTSNIPATVEALHDPSNTLDAHYFKGPGERAGGERNVVAESTMVVRRLTPVECERLQGFPDNYTRIPWKGKAIENCPDSPRYKAIGNSMAVPVMRWIGEGIQAVHDIPITDLPGEADGISLLKGGVAFRQQTMDSLFE